MRRTGCLLAVIGLCCGFEWPGRLPGLIYQSAHGNSLERTEAVQLLAHYPADSVREPLLLALEDEELDVRLHAATALGRAHVADAVPQLMEWLDAKLPELRVTALHALGAIDDPRAQALLTRALTDPLPAVRVAAVDALAPHSVQVMPQLMAALDDSDSSVRAQVATNLGTLQDAATLAPLANHARDEAAEVRRAVLRALGHSRAARALPLLEQGLADSDDAVHLAAIAALGDIDSAAAVAPLSASLRLGPAFAKAALAALGRTADPSAEQVLIDTLAQPELGPDAALTLLERVRHHEAQDASRSVAALAHALCNAPAGPYADLLASTLSEFSRFAPISNAVPQLMAALTEGRGDAHSLTRVLAHSGAQELLPSLLERVARADDPDLDNLLDALSVYFRAGLGDGRAVEPLLARLATAKGNARLKLLELIGQTQAPRALPGLAALLVDADVPERLAAVRAIGELPSSEANRKALWPVLESAEPSLRLAAARALARNATPSLVREVMTALGPEGHGDQHALLLALGESLARLPASPALDPELRSELLATLAHWTANSDDALSVRALDALRNLHDHRALEVIARLLRTPSARRRSAAVFALADFPHEDTRRLLRFVLQHDGSRVAVAAALALGEVGDQRDAAALARTAQRTLWPLPAAAAFGLVRMAQRGVSRRHSMQRMLCELAHSHDSYVRANVAAGLAALAAPACDETTQPLAWLDASHSPAVRAASAQWARALSANQSAVDPTTQRALLACASDSDPTLARSCRPDPTPAGPAQRLDAEIYAGDAQSPLREQLVALRLPDASVFVGYTDPNGHLSLPAAVSGDIVVEDPADTPPEP